MLLCGLTEVHLHGCPDKSGRHGGVFMGGAQASALVFGASSGGTEVSVQLGCAGCLRNVSTN